ncbi:glycosyltransferase family 4 protein [Candidatus Saganbacteria bacterium]|nr:glycosyltransferase family 4 protein [Candidatus Saganbacteria bacterium]
MKVLFIWHAAVAATYQKYIAELAEHPDLDITLLVPPASTEGSRYLKAFIPQNAKYKVLVGKTVLSGDNLTSFPPALPYFLWKEKPDIIHLFEEPWHNIAAYLTFWSKIICPAAKLIFQTFQNQVEDYRPNWIRTQRRTFERSSAAISCTDEGKAVLLHWGYNKPIHVIYPGVETRLFSPQDAGELRAKLGLKEFTIGYFGRMTQEKGIEDLIAAGKQLDFPYQFFFVGNGPVKPRLQSQVPEAIWLDAVTPNEISSYYSALDVLVLPSRTTKTWKEQFGRVLVEAMLCGVPVIGSSSGEIPKVIGDAGLVFAEQNPEALAKRITEIRNNTSLREDLKKKGMERGRSFDWKYAADQVYKVYENINN